MRAASLVFVVLLAAGCASPDGPTAIRGPDAVPTVESFSGEPVFQDHDHTDRLLHNASLNLELVALVKPWGDGSAYGVGSINELAVNGNRVFVSRSNPEGGFAIVDMTNPRAPKVIGDFHSEGGADVEVTSDGKFVLLMTQRTTPGTQTLDTPLHRAPRGIDVVDVSDPTKPTLSSFFPLPTNGPHTAYYYQDADGMELVAINTYDLLSDPTSGSLVAVSPATQRVIIAQLVRDANGARLEPRGAYSVTEPAPPGKIYFPHDAFIERHPITKKLLLYVAYWDAGVRIVDITNILQPNQIAEYHDFSPSSLAQMHDVKTYPSLVNGTQHVTAAAPEIVTAPEAGQITFIDTTNPASPARLGHWSIPGNLTVDQPFVFSPHVFDIDPQGHVVIGHYHGGVWLINARDPTNPTTIGYYFPHEERPGYKGTQPNVWGARFYNGYVLAGDSATGLYVLEPAAGAMMPAPPGRAS